MVKDSCSWPNKFQFHWWQGIISLSFHDLEVLRYLEGTILIICSCICTYVVNALLLGEWRTWLNKSLVTTCPWQPPITVAKLRWIKTLPRSHTNICYVQSEFKSINFRLVIAIHDWADSKYLISQGCGTAPTTVQMTYLIQTLGRKHRLETSSSLAINWVIASSDYHFQILELAAFSRSFSHAPLNDIRVSRQYWIILACILYCRGISRH